MKDNNRKKHMLEIENAISDYIDSESEYHNKPFKGQIIVKINCVNGYIANTSIYISKKGNKKVDFPKKMN